MPSCIIFSEQIDEIMIRFPVCDRLEPSVLVGVAEGIIEDSILSDGEIKTGELNHQHHIHCHFPEVGEPLASYHPTYVIRRANNLAEEWNARLAGEVTHGYCRG